MMVGGADADEPLLAENRPVVSVFVEETLDEREVERSVVDAGKEMRRIARHHVRVDASMLRQPRPKRSREQVFARRQRRADGKRLPPHAHGLEVAPEKLRLMAHALGAHSQSLPRRGQHELLAAIEKQLHAIRALERGDMLRHRRLGEGKFLGGPRVVERAAHREERLYSIVEHDLIPLSLKTPRATRERVAAARTHDSRLRGRDLVRPVSTTPCASTPNSSARRSVQRGRGIARARAINDKKNLYHNKLL